MEENGWDKRRRAVAARIERTALECFDEQNFSEVTAERIAERADVHVRTFFRYFAAKEDVVLALPRRAIRAVADALMAQPADMAPIDALQHAVVAADAALGEDTELRRLWFRVCSDAPELGLRVGVEIYATLLPLLAERFRTVFDDDDAGTLAGAAVGALQYLFAQWATQGGDAGLGDLIARGLHVLTTAGRADERGAELVRLRREVEELRAERDIFRRAAIDKELRTRAVPPEKSSAAKTSAAKTSAAARGRQRSR